MPSSNSSVEGYLSWFRQRSNVKGETFEKKLSTLLSRWRKVADDCNGDLTAYRITYGAEHREILNKVEMLNPYLSEQELRNFLAKEREQRIAIIENSISVCSGLDRNQEVIEVYSFPEFPGGPGTLDATSYILAEIENILR